MKKYHKIQTIFKRDMENKGKIIEGEFSLPEIEYLKDNDWVFTEKVDGTNIRIMWNGENVVFGGKTDNAQIPIFLLYKLQELFEGTAKKKLFKDVFGEEGQVCLYGEGYGNKIQKVGKRYNPEGVDFILFDVKIGDWWLGRENVEDIANKFNIKVVPIIGEGTINDMVKLCQKGFKSKLADLTAEGIVAKPKEELFNRKGERIIIKLKHKDFS